jgi:predicted Zn-dependent protease
VDSVGKALARVSHLPDLEWHFTLLDDPTVNAFAMPGGYIYITRGILAHLNSEAQLAGVLGHEIGHVTARHSAQRLTQQQFAGLGLGLASVFVKGFGQDSEAAQTALGLLFLKYGRDDENQADELGIQYATKAGYDPREIPSTYAMLKRIGERSGQRLPTFLSTHPDPGDRENRTHGLAQTAAAGKTNLQIRQRGYVQRLDGVVFGVDPRQGYFEGTRFYHPEMRFTMDFPAGWKTANGRQAVMAAEPNQKASMQLTLAQADGLSPAQLVSELRTKGSIVAAEGGSETVGGYAAWVGRLQVPTQSGGTQILAAAFIRRSADQMFQILGASSEPGNADEARVLASARSIRPLSDPARLNVTPDRVDVVSVTSAGAFDEVIGRFKSLAVGLDELAILNNVGEQDDVRRGELIKVVVRGQR